jgi:hypothetical protein
MTREELKAEALINLGSEPAPKEWEKLPCIKEQMPSCIGGEVSLQRFVGTDICAWFVGIGGLWEPQSDYFRVSLPPAEGAEEIDDETIAWAAEHQCGTPFSERWIGFVKGAKWHRSLHAQRIAEKMVEEKLREGLIAYGKVIRSWGIAIPSDILECSIDEYLKTRDSHE